jgi:hypothetical protein
MLTFGDMVVIWILHFVEGSKPIQVERVDPAEDEKQLRDYYETLKKRFEPTNLD